MKTKQIEYGTTFNVTVISASKQLIAVVADENNEGYLLMGHGISDLPKPDSKGTIIFTKSNGMTKGYWHFTPA